MANKRKCRECGVAFTGRSDKQYCSDMCRTAFYNRQNRDCNNHMRQVNKLLRQNRRILAMLKASGRTQVSRSVLIRKGFQFDFLTSVYHNQDGSVAYFCYEQGYYPLGDEIVVLIEEEEVVEEL